MVRKTPVQILPLELWKECCKASTERKGRRMVIPPAGKFAVLHLFEGT